MPYIPGTQSMSINEENCAEALRRLKIEFAQQVTLGLWGLRGSQNIDLVAYVPPRPVAIFVQGAYWHNAKTRTEDEFKQAEAERAGYRVLLVTEEQSATVEAAMSLFKREL